MAVDHLHPPFLVTAGRDRRGFSVDVTADASTAVVEMSVHGTWSDELGEQVTAGLRLCLAGPLICVLVDLRGLSDPYGVSMPFWTAVSQDAAPVRVVLCVPAPATLDTRLRQCAGRPLTYGTMTEARMAIAGVAAGTRRLQTRLRPHPLSVRAARNLVVQACQAWHLPQTEAARLVVSELAANAVEHARTEFVVTASTDGTRLHLAVQDRATGYPQMGEPATPGSPAPTPRGRGLQLVHATTDGWGAMPARGGKVVWATVPPTRTAELTTPELFD